MSFFNAVKVINLSYVIGIVAVAVFNNVFQAESENNIIDGVLALFVVLLISIPNLILMMAVPPKRKLIKTATVLNVVCILMFFVGLLAHEQEQLAIHWAITVIAICALNVVTLIWAVVVQRESQAKADEMAYL